MEIAVILMSVVGCFCLRQVKAVNAFALGQSNALDSSIKEVVRERLQRPRTSSVAARASVVETPEIVAPEELAI